MPASHPIQQKPWYVLWWKLFSHPSITMLQEERSRPCGLPMSTLWDLFANAHYKSSVCPIKIADGKGMRFKMPKPLALLFYWIWNGIKLKHKIADPHHDMSDAYRKLISFLHFGLRTNIVYFSRDWMWWIGQIYHTKITVMVYVCRCLTFWCSQW